MLGLIAAGTLLVYRMAMADTAKRSLQIKEDMRFHKIEWAVQRICRILMLVFVAAAACGIFGDGFLSKQTAKSGVLQIEYERFGRLQKKAFFKIRIGSVEKPESAQRKLWINKAFLENIKIERVEPEPARIQAGAQGNAYIFETSGANEAISILFYFRPDAWGKLAAVIRADDAGGEILLNQFIYP